MVTGWSPQQAEDFITSSPGFPWSIQPPTLDSSPLPRSLLLFISADLPFASLTQPCLSPLVRPSSFSAPPILFHNLSDVPPHLAHFYPKLDVPLALLPPPRMDAIHAAIQDVESRHASLPGQFPRALCRLIDAIHEKEHQWSIFVACRRFYAQHHAI